MVKKPKIPKSGLSGHESALSLLRFSIVGSLLAAPPPRGELGGELDKLAASLWTDPITGQQVRFGRSTIERWYYIARATNKPTAALKRKPRSDVGKSRVMTAALGAALRAQYALYPEFSVQCHYDNIAVTVAESPALAPLPSYSTVRRWMKKQGLKKTPRKRGLRPGEIETARRFAAQETRSYEVPYTHGLWHADVHHGSFRLPGDNGEWIKPKLMVFIDDYSRFVPHAQWFLDETAAAFVHALCQALMKGGLPRSLMIDNGAALNSGEVLSGLERLGILVANTRPYSPQQNAKIEHFWARVESRLVPMMGDVTQLNEKSLNDLTNVWLNADYHHRIHGETGVTPWERLKVNSVGRPCPDHETLIREFRRRITRKQRHSDGTVSVGNVRFEVPSAFRHLDTLEIRYAEWDLSEIEIIDERTGDPLFRLRPLDKVANAAGQRRAISDVPPAKVDVRPIAPLLRKGLEEQVKTGLVAPWIPFNGKPQSS